MRAGRLEDVSIIFQFASAEDIVETCEDPTAIGCATREFVDDRVQCTVDIHNKYITGYNITGIVNHEVGHCLGLGHSDDPDHVMGTNKRNVLRPHYDEIVVVHNVLWPDGKE